MISLLFQSLLHMEYLSQHTWILLILWFLVRSFLYILLHRFFLWTKKVNICSKERLRGHWISFLMRWIWAVWWVIVFIMFSPAVIEANDALGLWLFLGLMMGIQRSENNVFLFGTEQLLELLILLLSTWWLAYVLWYAPFFVDYLTSYLG